MEITRLNLNTGATSMVALPEQSDTLRRAYADIVRDEDGEIPGHPGWSLDLLFPLASPGVRKAGAAFFEIARTTGISKMPSMMAIVCFDVTISKESWGQAHSLLLSLESVLKATQMWSQPPSFPPPVPWLVVVETPIAKLQPIDFSEAELHVVRALAEAFPGTMPLTASASAATSPDSGPQNGPSWRPEEPDPKLPRPVTRLNALMKRFPGLGKSVDLFRAGRGNGLDNWPDWCVLPMAGWLAISMHERLSGSGPTSQELADLQQLAAIGAWRYSQGVYRIDPDLQAALTETVVKGPIPSEVLYRLPEWSSYVEPGAQLKYGPFTILGFWVYLEWDVNQRRPELRFLLDVGSEVMPVILHIGDWTVTEAVDRAVVEMRRNDPFFPADAVLAETWSEWVNPLVSIVLYLCSGEPEIDNVHQPGHRPGNPAPKRTRDGMRLFPADRVSYFDVGARIGQRLRQTREWDGAGANLGKPRRPHLRRAHWHGYWRGPRTNPTAFIYHWIPPVFVAGNSEVDGETLEK
ncbi:conserved protein of unknown function [Rhodovastum atsumiense]|uniref:Uncharacterized protein n=1 Tax=Rhodovastum atsumiense TaxID=504468 RepID=A0A5M6II93_9PROT|nr:hypothetical protein [Rhodovastum atsumiense]KAA5607986.1 hypothetical protein F1189_31225 [Rhodovastum atsumiense]CAH2603475.1 conserved protein of unknown function [Rhodovastum atsumiense]